MTTDPSCPTITEPPETIKRFRRGDTRADGRIFWSYHKEYLNGEKWFTPDQYARWQATRRRNEANRVKGPEARARHNEKIKAWKKRNSKKVTARLNARRKARRRLDPVYDLRARVRERLKRAIASHGAAKTVSSSTTLGCSWKYFAEHISNQFLPGMTWENRAEWQVDHIVPLAVAKTKQDVLDLSHFTNLRPLWKADNIAKGATLPPAELFPPHLLRFLPRETDV